MRKNDDQGGITVMRSSNGAPFHVYRGARAKGDGGTRCARPKQPTLGCGSVIHAIRFDYDSAQIRPESAPVLDALAEGIGGAGATRISILGQTSSEGSDAYNQDLSERRAASVADAMVARGIARDRLTSMGRGESAPIANNDTEAGRSLNRRVEVLCSN